jgi:hypothetical protein
MTGTGQSRDSYQMPLQSRAPQPGDPATPGRVRRKTAAQMPENKIVEPLAGQALKRIEDRS